MSTLSIVVVNRAGEGQEDFIASALQRMMPHIRKEPGLVSYEILRDPADPRRFVHVEKWESRPAFDVHVAAPHVAVWHKESEGKIESSEVYILEGFL